MMAKTLKEYCELIYRAIAYFAIKTYCVYTTFLFFREIEVVNVQNVPNNCPVIVYSNHNNQFVDGLLLTAQVKRRISFVTAAVSMRRNIIGHMLQASGAIPVERPQDVAVKGKGTIARVQNQKVFGEGTEFKKIKVKSFIKINKVELRVQEVLSDTELIVDTSGDFQIPQNSKYLIVPKLQYEDLYKHVWKAMNDQKCIGIFPQGGSHDRLELLPLKAGICIMALGAMEKYGCEVTLVPAGFHYYNPQNFRSKVVMEFGPAYKVPGELVQLYKTDQKLAISTLLDLLDKMLKSVTTQCKTFDQLSTLFTCRELYSLNINKQLTTKQKLELNRRFSKGFDKLTNDPKFKQSYQKLTQFNDFVKLNGLSLKSKKYNKTSVFSDICRFVFYFYKCALRLLIALPGFVLMGPTTTLIAYQAENERQRCLKKSDVKKQANDVVGSYKIFLSMIYFPITMFIHVAICYKILEHFSEYDTYERMKICLLIPMLMPFYALGFVKSYDSIGKSISKLKFLFVRIFKRSIYEEFNAKKKQMRKEIQSFVNAYGGQVIEDFQTNRIVKPQQIVSSSQGIASD